MSVKNQVLTEAYKFPREMRIIKTSDFGILVQMQGKEVTRASTAYFSATALQRPNAEVSLRIGITVGKKNAHRSVDRALVKRTLRETARKQAPYLIALLCDTGVGLDVSLRLKMPLSTVDGREVGVKALKQSLRQDAEKLLEKLAKRLHSSLHLE